MDQGRRGAVGPAAFRRSGRPDVPPAGRLAGLVARRVLAEQLWRDGLVPDAGGLRVDEVSPELLLAALREEPTGG